MQCSGAGKINLNPCGTCHGSKTSTITEEFELDIPPGVTEEYALQFKGKGNQFGRFTGDLLIRLTVIQLRKIFLGIRIFYRWGKAIFLKEKVEIFILRLP